MRKQFRRIAFVLLLLASLLMTGCNGNLGIGMSVGVPIGNHGYMRVGGGRWY